MDIEKKLDELAALPPGWDSYKAKPIDAVIIAKVRAMLRELPRLCSSAEVAYDPPQITPTNDGGLQFEWHNKGYDFEIELPPQDPVSAYISNIVTKQERDWSPKENEIAQIMLSYMRDPEELYLKEKE